MQGITSDASIRKLVELEPEIYKKIKALKVTAANFAVIKELQQKTAKKATSNRGSGGTLTVVTARLIVTIRPVENKPMCLLGSQQGQQ